MSITYSYPCPKCSRLTRLTESGTCQNQTNNGNLCGYELPKELNEFNGMIRSKIAKHTTEPTGAFEGMISFNQSSGFYLENLRAARASGDIYLDARNGYFCTYITPLGNAAIATLCSGNSSNQLEVSGYKMPLNSKVQKLHGHYDNLDSAMIYVAAPEDVTVVYPSVDHPNEFRILQSGSLVAAWNTDALSGFAGNHIVFK